MDPLLLALVVVSLLSAIGFGGFAVHLLREDHRRSAARVAALTSAIDATAPATPTAGVHDLFVPTPSAAAHGSPLIKIAVGVAMALALIVVVASANRRGDAAEPGTAGGATQSASTAAVAPLELISMRHTREGDTLTVSGLVRNPRAGRETTRVTAVILTFNRAGAYINSGRAALDFTTLQPGDESPFVVTIPSAADVGRYRVSFRTEAGVIRHVDRRSSDQTRLAAAQLQ
jgi:hypothetical protein